MREIKALHPDMLIANYSILESESSDPNNTAMRDIYDKLYAEKGPHGNGDWWARDANGMQVGYYSGTNSTNPTDFVTPDANGDRFSQWLAKRERAVTYDPVPEFDVWFADNVFYKQRTVDPDWDGDGVNDDSENPANWAYFRQGIANHLKAVKEQIPHLMTLGNADGLADAGQGFLRDPEYQGLLDGALLEHAIGQSYSPEVWAGWENTMASYRSLMDHTNAPHLVIFHYHSNTPSYAEMRYSLASTLMDDGYFAANDTSYTNPQWYDELDLDLGHAVDAPQRAPWQNGVYRRRFEKGLAIVNPKGNGPQTVTIEPGYQRFRGTQDPLTNNGQAVSTITLAERQGIVLIKGPADNHAPVAHAGPNQIVDLVSGLSVPVVLDGSGSSDADGDALTYSWSWPGRFRDRPGRHGDAALRRDDRPPDRRRRQSRFLDRERDDHRHRSHTACNRAARGDHARGRLQRRCGRQFRRHGRGRHQRFRAGDRHAGFRQLVPGGHDDRRACRG